MSNALILNGLKGKERQDMTNQIVSSERLLKRVEQLLQQELDKVVEPDFSNPNWALEQAYNLGYKKGLTRLLKYVIIK